LPLLGYLRRVIPVLGIRYQQSFDQHKTAQMRFDILTEGCFEKQIILVKEEVSVAAVSNGSAAASKACAVGNP